MSTINGLQQFPAHVWPIVFYVKRFYKQEWGSAWKSHFSFDLINGKPGNELKFDNRKIMAGYLRVGFTSDGLWRTFKTRIDFIAASKIQTEDGNFHFTYLFISADISACVTVPTSWIPYISSKYQTVACKVSCNCEFRLFQRPGML